MKKQRMFSNLPQIIELVRSKAGIQIQISLNQSLQLCVIVKKKIIYGPKAHQKMPNLANH